MLDYKTLYRSSGIKRKSELLSPNKRDLAKFKFPRESIWHYLPDSDESELVIPDINSIVDKTQHYLVNLITRHTHDPKFVSRMRSIVPDVFYRQAYQQISSLPKTEKLNIDIYKRHPATLKAKNNVVVEIYEPIESTYIYRDLPMTPLYKWEDLSQTIVDNINNISDTTDRNHFLFVTIPDSIPRYSEFLAAQRRSDRVHLTPFFENNSLLLLEIFKWVGGASNILSKLTHRALDRLTLVLCNDVNINGKYALLNLGWLNDQIVRDPESPRGAYQPEKAQKIIVNLFNQIIIPTDKVEEDESHDDIVDELPTEIEDPEVDEVVDTAEPPEEVVDVDEISDDELDSALEKGTLIKKSTKATAVAIDIDNASEYRPKQKTLTAIIDSLTDKLVSDGSYSIAEAKRLQMQARSIETIKNPLGEGTLKEFLEYNPADLKIERKPTIKDRKTIIDKEMLTCVTQEFNSRYIKEYLYKDILNFATSIQNAGVIVSDITMEQHETLMDNYYRFKMEVQPVPGKATTMSFDIPIPNSEGVYMSGGVKYYLKKQTAELPIRKVSPSRVALTSYMGKLFVDRKDAVKNNYGRWLLSKMMAISLDPNDKRITDIVTGNVFKRNLMAPKVLTTIATRYNELTINTASGIKLRLNLDITKYAKFNPRMAEVGIVLGPNGGNSVYIDSDDVFYIDNTPIGTIEELLGFTHEVEGRVHTDAVVVNVFGQKIGIGLVLAMEMGLSTLIKTLGCRYRRVESGRQRNMTYNEYSITFKNETLIFDRRDKLATLIMSSFLDYKSNLAKYPSNLFNDKDIYILILEENGLTARYYSEIDNIYKMFIDHITHDLLVEMNMPVDMGLLLLEAANMLTHDSHPDEADTAYMRKRGYERLGGLVYAELVNSIRSMNTKPNTKRRKLEMNPMAVKMAIISDSSQEIYQEINPIHALKQNEITTLGGTGGRSFDALSMNIRGFHKSSLGTISESSVDNKNAGAITYLSSNPKINSLRGTSDRYDPSMDKGVSSLLSTSALLAPGSEHDDPKRIGYTSVQNSHVIPAVGYTSMPVVTGKEQTIAEQMENSIFAAKADKDGIVIDLTRTVLKVKYADDSIGSFEIGRRFGKSAGETIPHSIVTDYKVGDKFKGGDVLVYNEYFFEKDYMLGLVYKGAVPVTVGFCDMAENYEDSNLVAPSFTERFKTKSTYVREVIIKFDQHLHNLVNVGQVLDTETPLCIIEEETTANFDDVDPELLKSLMNLGRNAPKSRHMGVVEKIEIRYRGEKSDMNDTLQELAEFHDRVTMKHRAALGLSKLTNQINEPFRYGKTIVDNNHMLILIYITEDVSAGIGDKGVLGNQMKFTIGKAVSDQIYTTTGTKIDMLFGIRPMNNRMVGHAEKIGTTNTLLKVLAKRALEMYKPNN